MARPRGRPPAPRGVYSFESADAELPGELLLDTSYVVEALISSQPLHAGAVALLVRLAEADVGLRFSSMLEIELAETAFQLALKERHPRDWRRYRHDGRARGRAVRLMGEVQTAWEAVLDYFDYTRFDAGEMSASVPGLMSAYGLASYDAVHAATALESPAVGIVTTDVGFASLPTSTVIYTDSSRLARCRQIRARR